MIDQDGKIFAPLIYEEIGGYQYGRAIAKREGKFGYLDYDGKEVIPCIYEKASPFLFDKVLEKPKAQVNIDGSVVYIFDNGEKAEQ
ncbi:MAG: WG repeat-containing protein [Bacteroidetes bacterium]|nr:WG repeat-containing protein [Bacteroidota bacterium]MBU1718849.1 WG repeat-containing protein [Bacteroidota bacterium]